MMNARSIIKSKKTIQTDADRQRATFNRLRKRIETLQNDLQQMRQDLDECLVFYHAHIPAAEKSLVATLTELVKSLDRFYKDPSRLSPHELQTLKEWMLTLIDEMFCLTPPSDAVDSEIKTIFQDLKRISYEKIMSDQFNCFKNEMQEMFNQSGVKVDLSEIDIQGDEQDIMKKFFEAMSSIEEKPTPPKPKSKKQLQKEMKEHQFKEMQKQGLSTIYKRLARAFHPDLEQDSAQKAEKEILMKRLTTAYQDEDLYTLLSLEIEWMKASSQQPMQKASDELKVYNAILKEQIETLKESINMLILHPKYLPLEPFFNKSFFGLFFLEMAHSQIKSQEQKAQTYLQQLRGNQALKKLQLILSQI